MSETTIRAATLEDVSALNALIHESAAVLSTSFYSRAQIASLNRYVFGVDTQLVHDGTYFVCERDAQIAACGGWSARRTLFGGDQHKGASDPLLQAATDAARIRAFFVKPEFARQGLGRQLLMSCEQAARAAGFRRTELMATLPGVPLYRAMGYEPLEAVSQRLPDEVVVEFVRMGRQLL